MGASHTAEGLICEKEIRTEGLGSTQEQGSPGKWKYSIALGKGRDQKVYVWCDKLLSFVHVSVKGIG